MANIIEEKPAGLDVTAFAPLRFARRRLIGHHEPIPDPLSRIREKIGFVDLQFLLIQILIKLGVATAVASALGRSREYKKLLFSKHRSRTQ